MERNLLKQKGPFVKGKFFYCADHQSSKINKKRTRIAYSPRKPHIPYEVYPEHKMWRLNQRYMDDD